MLDSVLMEDLLPLEVLTHQLSSLRYILLELYNYLMPSTLIAENPISPFLLQISKIKQMMLPDAKDGPVRPVIRTFYDHVQVSAP